MEWEFKKEYICPKDKKSIQRYKEYKDYYKIKYDICKKYNPKSILEIGVRAGYSAISFLNSCPDATYVGLDAENKSHGGQGGPWMWWAKEILKPYSCNFYNIDTQKQNDLKKYGSFDFIHIDGDHSFNGALHDINICWEILNENGVILIDDIDYIKDVKKAVDFFINSKKNINSEYIKSLRGEMIIYK